jgi:hypothetical protein
MTNYSQQSGEQGGLKGQIFKSLCFILFILNLQLGKIIALSFSESNREGEGNIYYLITQNINSDYKKFLVNDLLSVI